MAAETEASATKAISLSENETKLFISIMKNLESDIAFNADAVAQECGYKSAKVVKDRWSQIKNKLGISAAATAGKKATPKKRKGEGEEGAEEAPTPTKKARTPKAKKEESPVKGEVVKEEGEEDVEE